MAVAIRLTRTGAKDQPSYRIVVAEKASKRDGKYLEMLGYFNPRANPKVVIKMERYEHWLKVGAQPTEAVRRLVNEVAA